MTELEKLADFFMRENAKANAERMVLKQLITNLISRHAREHDSTDEYIMTLTAASMIGFDETPPEDEMGRMAFDHGASYCNEIETAALALVRDG
ncbi:MAG: hypothetical protein ABJF86_06720 [Tateyamaria sp.]|uniref:hypothetical protein n=1 Tax=Tateyamaria sp. TaxID=1929288 RepID=UPI003288C1D7